MCCTSMVIVFPPASDRGGTISVFPEASDSGSVGSVLADRIRAMMLVSGMRGWVIWVSLRWDVFKCSSGLPRIT